MPAGGGAVCRHRHGMPLPGSVAAVLPGQARCVRLLCANGSPNAARKARRFDGKVSWLVPEHFAGVIECDACEVAAAEHAGDFLDALFALEVPDE